MRRFEHTGTAHSSCNEETRLRRNTSARVLNAQPKLLSEEKQPLLAQMLKLASAVKTAVLQGVLLTRTVAVKVEGTWPKTS